MARPPRLPDFAILALIGELRAQHGVLTGTRLRAELARRHGSPFGVTRVYRLLRQATRPDPRTTVTELPGDVTQMQVDLTRALNRARLAEEREDAHQSRWATEVDTLRASLRGAQEAIQRLPILEAELQNRSRELAAVYHRIADLEAQLRRLRGD